MNIKILKIFIIAAIALIVGAEVLFLTILPAFVNSFFEKKEFVTLVKEKTGLDLNYKKIKLKTYPDFSAKISADNLTLFDKKQKIVTVKNIDTKIFLPTLLFKKLTLKSLHANDFSLLVIRNKDKNLYFGNYKIPFNFDVKEDVNLDLDNLNIINSTITFDDKLVNQTIKGNISKTHLLYKKNKKLKLVLDSEIFVNNKAKTFINVDLHTALNNSDCLKSENEHCYLKIQNLDLADYKNYISYFNQDIQNITGVVNALVECDKQHSYVLKSSVKNFKADMKNPLDSVKSNGDITVDSVFNFKNNNLYFEKILLASKDWTINITGQIQDYTKSYPHLDLSVVIPSANINSLYWLAPSFKDDPFNVMQKFKKYGAWGIANGRFEIKGSAEKPEIYGNLTVSDVYIVKNNPIVPHCKVFAEFMKDKVTVSTRVFAGYGEYVDINGVAVMKPYGEGEFDVVSSPNVDLATAEYMLIPIHEVVGFDIGPVPYMTIKGKGNINLKTKGTILDGNAYGQFNFKNTTATLQGLNTVLENADGTLDFNGRDMHFYTKNAFVKKQKVKVDGKANLNGNIDFDITSAAIDIKDLFEILQTSSILETQKKMADPIESVSGKVKTSINLTGKVKDYGDVLKENTLSFNGIIELIDCKGAIKFVPVSVNKLKGKIEFKNTNWKTILSGKIGTSPISINGQSSARKTHIKIAANALKTDELSAICLKDLFDIQFPFKTDSLISFNAEYNSNNDKFDANKIKAKGFFIPSKKTLADDKLNIRSGSFDLNKGDISFKHFNAKLLGSDVIAEGKIRSVFSENPNINGRFNIKEFNISTLNTIKNSQLLPPYIADILNAYENYQGVANIALTVKNNFAKGSVDLRDVKFNNVYFKTPVVIDRGSVVLDGQKAFLRSFVAQIDDTPVFLNLSVYDLDKNAQVRGYFTTKISEQFVNKYVNTHLTYPIKIKGDITLTSDVKGSLNRLRIHPKLKLEAGADIYYMGANLGDESESREIEADINVEDNNLYVINSLKYIRYMTSQNDSSYPLPVLVANGSVKADKNSVYVKNLNVETLNKANIKIFNVLFKKSVLKKGLFNCKLNIKGDVNNPVIRGFIDMDNLDMPLYDTVVKNILVKFNDKNIEIKTSGEILNSDFTVFADVVNNLRPPFVINNLDIKSQKLKIDTLIDYLSCIPTPNTALSIKDKETPVSKSSLNISDFRIKKGTIFAKEISIRNLNADNLNAEFLLGDNLVLQIPKLEFGVTTGQMSGSASYEFNKAKIKANVSAFNVDSNKVASSFFDFKDQIYGSSNGNIVITTSGATEEERIKNMSGYVYFEIADGKMPKLGSVEYLLKAGNFIKSGITGASINNFIDLIAPVKTGYFDSIKGHFALKNGVAQNIEVYSKGDNLNIYINGEYDLLHQYANMRVFGRLTRRADNILGKIGNVSFNTLLAQIPGIKLDNKDKMKIIRELNKIPGVELSDKHYRIFTVKIDGKVDEDKYVRNFRWIE